MKSFFLEKFEFDFYASKNLIECIEQQEAFVSSFVLKSFSHIINAHHIWLSRLKGSTAESHFWDELPMFYFQKLHEANHTETIDFIERIELENKVNYHSSEGVEFTKSINDVLYHILNHSNYHRAQIIMDLKNNNLAVPSFNFITFK
jgi:uncharacterized damage-inducible protein DinB